jgi:hypothetical protein
MVHNRRRGGETDGRSDRGATCDGGTDAEDRRNGPPAVAACGGGSSHPDYAWVQLGPEGEATVRVITSALACPPVRIDDADVPMSVRAEAAAPLFQVLTCEATLPPGAVSVSVGRTELRVPDPEPETIAVIGDTGCRLSSTQIQACDDPVAWPFAQVAASVAAFAPDLVVHVGDYLYREAPCPDGDAGCAGSPWGYNWPTIEADFFAPARPLLPAAPLVLVRGNHESCSRAGPVWFRFLDPRPFPDECSDYTDPYAIEGAGPQFLMLDSSNANDDTIDPSQLAVYQTQFAEIAALAREDAFFLTHRPIWGFGHDGVQNGMEVLFEDNVTLQAASDSVLPPGVRAVLSGHIHLLELLSFDGPRPPQLIIGNSGVEMDDPITTPLAGLEIAGATVRDGLTYVRFGFTTLERDAGGWRVVTRDETGAPLSECFLSGDGLACP